MENYSRLESTIPYVGEGYLILNVSSAGGALPIKDARIHVTGADTQNRNIEYNIATNSSGASEKIALKTPPRSLSLSPGSMNGYAKYTAVVTKDGYYTQRFTNLPVFDGITSIQPVLLIPLAPYDTENFDPLIEQVIDEAYSAEL